MNNQVKQSYGLIGAAIAAAACAGKVAVIAAISAVGLGAIVEHAYLYPIFVGFVAFALWMLYLSARAHDYLAPFWLSLAGGTFGSVALWLSLTGTITFPGSWHLFVAAVLFLSGSVWDFIYGRRHPVCASPLRDLPKASAESGKVALGKRAVNGVALSIAAAAAFYGMYKSIDTFAPKAEAGEIACWGINQCKGTTACSTAHNGCNGRNDCRGRGWKFVAAKECAAHGGIPLRGSPHDSKS
jgi:mercuric ion transport protein